MKGNPEKDQLKKKACRTRLCLIITGLLLAHLAAAVVIAIYFGVTASQSDNDDKITVAEMNGQIGLHINYTEEFEDHTSELYKEYSLQFCGEIGRVVGESEAAASYLGCTVNGLMKGSVLVNYTTKFIQESNSGEWKILDTNSRIETAIQDGTFMNGLPATVETEAVLTLTSVDKEALS